MRSGKRFLTFLLACLLAFGCPVAAAAAGPQTPDQRDDTPVYTLTEEVILSEDATPLGAGPREEDCCVLHFVLMLCTLGVAVYYVGDRKRRQQREFELRAELK